MILTYCSQSVLWVICTQMSFTGQAVLGLLTHFNAVAKAMQGVIFLTHEQNSYL